MNYYIGAYATSPTLYSWDRELATRYMNGIKSMDLVRGLEHPFWGSLHKFDDDWFMNTIHPDWDYVFTCIPGTMVEMGKNPHFGLASENPAGRISAEKFILKANNAVKKLNNFLGRNAVKAVVLHSAPNRAISGVSSSKESFIRSLLSIAEWDWQGANLMVEHCDAWNGKYTPEKGFLPLDEEIGSIKNVNRISKGQQIGIFLNWGRSVIEGRNTDTIIEHIRLAKENDLLRGLFLSGCSDQETPWGMFKDTHMPPSACSFTRYFAEKSLMTYENIQKSLMEANAEQLEFIGIKLLDALHDSSIDRRVGINQDMITIIEHILLNGSS